MVRPICFVRLGKMGAFLFCSFLGASLIFQQAGTFQPPERTVSLGQMFTFFFLMLGPMKILGPFVQLTRQGDEKFARKLAVRAFLYSCIALVIAAYSGEKSIRNYHISIPVLAIAAGIILFLVALKTVMEQFDTSQVPGAHEYEPSMRLALSPLAFPVI